MTERRAGLLYCGGCNPRYDRVAAAEGLRAACPGWHFAYAQPGTDYHVLVVVCGCGARCAATGHITAGRTLVLDRPDAFEKARQTLGEIQ